MIRRTYAKCCDEPVSDAYLLPALIRYRGTGEDNSEGSQKPAPQIVRISMFLDGSACGPLPSQSKELRNIQEGYVSSGETLNILGRRKIDVPIGCSSAAQGPDRRSGRAKLLMIPMIPCPGPRRSLACPMECFNTRTADRLSLDSYCILPIQNFTCSFHVLGLRLPLPLLLFSSSFTIYK
jgi:hypothetical protein